MSTTHDDADKRTDKQPQVPACPECGSGSIETRGRGRTNSVTDCDWVCKTCDARFDDPDRTQGHPANIGGLSAGGRKLLAMDPDDLQEGGA